MTDRRLTIVGGGRMGYEHFKACKELRANACDITVVDPLSQARSRFAELGIRAVGDLSAVDERELDMVVVASPTSTHLPILKQVSHLPIDCLVEKPCAVTSTAFQELEAVSAAGRARFRVGLWRRFSAPFRMLRDTIRSGLLGEVRMVLACQWDASPPGLTSQSVKITGGIGLDCGVHETDTVRWLSCGTLSHLSCLVPASPLAGIADADSDQLIATGSTDLGIPVTICLSRTCGGIDEIFYRVIGSRGSAELVFGQPSTLTLRSTDHTRIKQTVFQSDMTDALACQMRALADQNELDEFAGIADVRMAAMPWIDG